MQSYELFRAYARLALCILFVLVWLGLVVLGRDDVAGKVLTLGPVALAVFLAADALLKIRSNGNGSSKYDNPDDGLPF